MEYPKPEQVKAVYDMTSGPCSLLRFLVGLFGQLNSEDFKTVLRHWDNYPTAFTRDLMKLFVMNVDSEKQIDWNAEDLKAELCSGRDKGSDLVGTEDEDVEVEEASEDEVDEEGSADESMTSLGDDDGD